ncbi:MAG: hypothetical protein AAF561_01630 [Planctomycetota bacterium]
MSTPTNDVERRRLQRVDDEKQAELFCPTARPRPRDLPEDVPFCPHDRRLSTVVNVSRDGVGVVADRPLPVGAYQKLRIDESNVSGEAPEFQIVRCEPRGDGTFSIGARRS